MAMNRTQLIELLASGKKMTVVFNSSNVEHKESCIEVGMRAEIVNVGVVKDDCYELTFNLKPFEEHNRQFESANYYDRNGKPTRTAREAGFWNDNESFYCDPDEDLSTLFAVVDDGSLQLYAEYQASKSGTTYVQWLEANLLSERQGSRDEHREAPRA